MNLRARVLLIRAGWLLRLENRRRRRQLTRELAGYSTQAELDDLHAILECYPDGQTHEIRTILHGQQMRRQMRRHASPGGSAAAGQR